MERREFLKVAVFGMLGAALPARAMALAGERAALPAGGLLHPLQPGQEIGLGWRLLEVHPPEGGAIRLLLGRGAAAAAELVRVDLVLRDGAPRGPAWTENIDLMVMDGATDADGGQRAMPEHLGRALRRLAAIVQRNDALLDPGPLLTYQERAEARKTAQARRAQARLHGEPV